MSPRRAAFLAALVLSLGLAVPGALGQAPDTGAAGGSDQDPQVLTRGAVHEAFAAPVPGSPTPGLVIPKEPPAAIEEMPPDQKPAGANVQWIPGYWSWDQGRTDFVWISGVWREPPPGRQWVPGYWHQVDGGFQWVPGTWVPVPQPQGGGAGPAGGPATQAAYMPVAAGEPGNRAEFSPAGARRVLVAGKLVLARKPVRLAPWFLGGRAAQLGLDPAALCLDARRLPVR